MQWTLCLVPWFLVIVDESNSQYNVNLFDMLGSDVLSWQVQGKKVFGALSSIKFSACCPIL